MANSVCKKSETSKGENSKKSRGKEEILPLYREWIPTWEQENLWTATAWELAEKRSRGGWEEPGG